MSYAPLRQDLRKQKKKNKKLSRQQQILTETVSDLQGNLEQVKAEKDAFINISINKNEDKINEKLTLSNYIKNFTNENKSMISDHFFGTLEFKNQCQNCNIINFSFEQFYYLIFPIKEILAYKNEQFFLNNQNMMNINQFGYQQNLFMLQNFNSITLDDCFGFYQKINYSRDNKKYCSQCNNRYGYSFKTEIYSYPNILLIILDRGKEFDFKIKLEFNEVLYYKNKNESGNEYKLIGIITYEGKKGQNKHFIAFCKDPIGNQWHKFDDEIVKDIQNFEYEIIDYGIPYILFYQKEHI